MKNWAFNLLLGALLGVSIAANALELRSDHPDVYVVKKSDTLWDISATFLEKPWLWPEIWQVNPQVSNPHLIYPGDVLSLVYINGQPRIVRRPGVVKLSPQIREISRGEAITSLPLEIIRPFLVGARVVSEEELDNAPYLVATDGDRLVASQGTRFYARGLTAENIQVGYAMFSKGKKYMDPVTNEFLGYEAIHLGASELARPGDPATLDVTESVKEMRIGDRLLPVDEEQLQPVFFPHSASSDIEGQIISVYEGVTQIGQYHVVVLNRGTREGVEVGHVFTAWHKGPTVKDPVARERKRSSKGSSFFKDFGETISGGGNGDTVTLPDEEAGEVMVFRTFEKVSLALVVNASRPIHVLDRVKNPY